MLAKVLGIMELDFNTPEGDHISGTKLFVCYKDPKVQGLKTKDYFVNNEVEIPDIKQNEDINIYFNDRGKVEAIVK